MDGSFHTHLELLSGASLELAKPGEPRARMASVLSLLRERICQQLVLDIHEPDGGHTWLSAFGDPELERLALELTRRYPPQTERHPVEVALRTRDVMLREVTDEHLLAVADDPAHLAQLRGRGATEVLVAALRVQGRCVGVLSASTDRGRRFSAADRLFVELLSERLAAYLERSYFRSVLRAPAELGALGPAAELELALLREREAHLELERQGRRLRALTESELPASFEWGPDGVITSANDTFLALAGATRRELAASALDLRVLFRLPRDLAGSPFDVAQRQPRLLEGELCASGGDRIPVLLWVSGSAALPSGGLGFVIDVSEQRRRSELETLLLGIVSHDLRNPLGVVSMAVSLLKTQELTEFQSRLVNRIEAAGRKSARLIGDLLDFTVIRSAGIELSQRSIDLHALVAQTLDDLHATWPDRVIEHQKVGEATSRLDAARLEQIVANLVGNALQHGVLGAPVVVQTRGEPAAVVLSVLNQGRPIPEDVMTRLFAPLRRGENAGERRGSIGLGLFIVHHLVRAHGGTIDVSSSAAQGTLFTVRLPRSQEEALAGLS